MSRSHSFSVEIAKSLGVNVALMINHFSFWYLKNQSDGVNFKEGDYWVRMKIATMKEYYPYYSERQLRHLIDKMIDFKLLKQDEFNAKKNDRTKWYCLTKKSKELLHILTDKNVSHSTDKNVSRTDKNVTSIIGDTKYRYSSSSKEKEGKLFKNLQLIESIAMKNKIKRDTVKNQISVFIKHISSIENHYNNDTDLYMHFGNWIRKQNLKEIDVEIEISWFLQMFNRVSKREFLITDEMRWLFSGQLKNGFSGEQMERATHNLYSSSFKNKWHIDSYFKFATPTYLLKGDNLNKYLNVKL